MTEASRHDPFAEGEEPVTRTGSSSKAAAPKVSTTADETEETDMTKNRSHGSFPSAAAEMANETEVEQEPAGPVPDAARLEQQLAERTADLQRLQAEYVNYKRRVDRDRELVKQNATYAALAPITEVIDTIDRAREHGEVEGGFKAVADQLERILAGVGLVKFGAVGDPFDPTIHEALSHIGEDPDVSVTTCKVIAKAGYRIGDRVVRAAQVLVVDPVAETGAETRAASDGAPAGPSEAAEPTEPAEATAADDVHDNHD